MNLDMYSDKQKIQQYVLVVLYFSTNGNDWSHNDGWLSNEDKCEFVCLYWSIVPK